MSVCSRLTADGLGISASKSVVTASTKKLGEAVAKRLKQFGIKCVKKVKPLGIGMASGTQHDAGVLKARLKNFKKRTTRFQRLRKAGIDTAKLIRTGGGAAITYGEFACGVSPSLLLNQRRTVGAATATEAGTGGQNLDLALILADGSEGASGPSVCSTHTTYWALGDRECGTGGYRSRTCTGWQPGGLQSL